MHLQHCPQKVAPLCCSWPLRTVPFPLSTISEPNARPWVSSTPLLGAHQEINTVSDSRLALLGWWWWKWGFLWVDAEMIVKHQSFLRGKVVQGFQRSHLSGFTTTWRQNDKGGLSDFRAFHPRPSLFLGTGCKTEAGALERCAVRHFEAA